LAEHVSSVNARGLAGIIMWAWCIGPTLHVGNGAYPAKDTLKVASTTTFYWSRYWIFPEYFQEYQALPFQLQVCGTS